MKKRILALMLSGAMLMSAMPVMAEDYASCSLNVENGKAKADFVVESDEEGLQPRSLLWTATTTSATL